MYIQGSGPAVSAKEFSTSCFEQDLLDYENEEGRGSTDRWQIAGRRGGPMYWLSPGRGFTSKASVAFAGVHSMQSQVYFIPGALAVAMWTDQEAQEEMEIPCKGVEAIHSLERTREYLETLRIVKTEGHGTYRYCGDWMITHVTKQAEDQALISLLGVFPAWT
ncbi:hypothetical protein WJX77_009352 [Trebouxia sp. C0004]